MGTDDPFDRASDRSITRQLADFLRDDIAAGRLAAGDPLPSELTLMQSYGVARTTARAALVELRAEGLAVTHPGRGSFVAGVAERRTVTLPPGATVTVRHPTEPERRAGHGVRVVEVTGPDGDTAVHQADEVILRVPDARE
ncbi:MAG TPA: winged helix-turn-helix domain-containing protein [Pseudonocardiaceae bacterium]|nr:winged helix-turn-helix domain-containing protein [Pseudonocardiaceae bacterium]